MVKTEYDKGSVRREYSESKEWKLSLIQHDVLDEQYEQVTVVVSINITAVKEHLLD